MNTAAFVRQEALESSNSDPKALAREIHDEIGGGLTSLRFSLASLEKHVDGAMLDRIQIAQSQLGELIRASQRIAMNLRAPELKANLLPVLHQHIDRIGFCAELPIRFACNESTVVLQEAIAHALCRVLQESLTNVSKHAQASEVFVTLTVNKDLLLLQVTDNGNGFRSGNQTPSDLGGHGLATMSERASLVGGWLDIKTVPGRGTTVLLGLPPELPTTTAPDQ